MEPNDLNDQNYCIYNERMQTPIPDRLILKKGDGSSSGDITVYDLIAYHIGLSHRKHDIYVSQSGEEFIRNKFGFRPIRQHNLSLYVRELKRKVEELEYKLKMVKRQLENCQQASIQQAEKNKERLNKAKSVFDPLQKENKRLRQEMKALKNGLRRFMQMNESVIDKLMLMSHCKEEERDAIELNFKDFDWSSYDESFNLPETPQVEGERME